MITRRVTAVRTTPRHRYRCSEISSVHARPCGWKSSCALPSPLSIARWIRRDPNPMVLRRFDLRAAALAPRYDHEVRLSLRLPTDLHATAVIRQSAIFQGIGPQLMQRHCQPAGIYSRRAICPPVPVSPRGRFARPGRAQSPASQRSATERYPMSRRSSGRGRWRWRAAGQRTPIFLLRIRCAVSATRALARLPRNS